MSFFASLRVASIFDGGHPARTFSHRTLRNKRSNHSNMSESMTHPEMVGTLHGTPSTPLPN